MRGIPTPEPADVADAIVEALQTGRYEVYVPRRMAVTMWFMSLIPRRVADFISKAMGADQLLIRTDHTARAQYEARMDDTINGGAPEAADSVHEPVAVTETEAA
jgi:hypothetical protein